jgi:hypothetical protein
MRYSAIARLLLKVKKTDAALFFGAIKENIPKAKVIAIANQFNAVMSVIR